MGQKSSGTGKMIGMIVVLEYFLCVWNLICFLLFFYKVLDIIIVLFYSLINKHEKVQLTVQDCTVYECKSSDSDPTILMRGFPSVPHCYYQLVVAYL